ncbi:hypothetical protein [Sphingomonas flavalba]|uniref:hypothetical protein n=1 Tax=Sphingomonas flavalba TaxID=2559804 RepID=UPI00109D89C4|nr:hypothetical protein [Sphingomonas flavalba]
MHQPTLLLVAATALAAPAAASAATGGSTTLDIDKLGYEIVHDVARRTILALDKDGQPLSLLLRIGNGQFLPPHGGGGPIRLLTVVSGTLTWGDGNTVDPAAERRLGPGTVVVLPAGGGEHWAAARDGDVLLQVVLVRGGSLTPTAAAQVTP